MVMNLKRALKIDVGVYRTRRGGSLEKKYYSINFGDKVFWGFLNTDEDSRLQNQEEPVREVVVPEEFFPDFLRGLFDGRWLILYVLG